MAEGGSSLRARGWSRPRPGRASEEGGRGGCGRRCGRAPARPSPASAAPPPGGRGEAAGRCGTPGGSPAAPPRPPGARGSLGGASAAGTDGSGSRGTARGHVGGAHPEVRSGAGGAGAAEPHNSGPAPPAKLCPSRAQAPAPLRAPPGPQRCGTGRLPRTEAPAAEAAFAGLFSGVSWGLRLFFLFAGALSICLARSPHQPFSAWASPFALLAELFCATLLPSSVCGNGL